MDASGQPVVDADGAPKMRKLGASCPKLSQKGHGTWYFYFELDAGEGGKRQRVRRGGFATKDDAKAEAAKVYRDADRGADVLSSTTVGEDLRRWLKRKKALARTTRHGYEEHIHLYLERTWATSSGVTSSCVTSRRCTTRSSGRTPSG